MASKIRIFRSTGATAPGSLEYGELAVTVEQGTAGTSANKAGRLFIGNSSGNPVEIGGEYTYKLLDHTPGELINSSAALVNSSGQIDGWNVSGILTATRAEFGDINVSAAATVGVLTVTNNVNIGGALFIQGAQVLAEGGAASFQNLKVTGITTLGDASTDLADIQARATFSTDATFSSNSIVVGVSTFTGAVDMNGGLDVSGGETVLSSATVSDLVDNQVVIAGASGSLEGDANFTFDGTTLNVAATIDATVVDAATLRAPVGVVTALTSTDVVGTAGTFTTAFTLGSGGTKYTLPVADGSANQVLTTNGSGAVSFQEVSSTLVISAGAAATDAIDLRTQTFTVAATNNETKTTLTDNTITVGLATDVIVGGGLTVTNNLLVLGNLTVEGTETIINVDRLDVQDKTIGVASTSTASNTTANGAGFFVHGGADGNKEILWSLGQSGFEVNQDWLPSTDDTFSLGNASREWKNLFVDGLAELDDVNVSAAATIATLNVTGTGTIATVDINGGNIDGTTIGAASSAAGTFTNLSFNTLTGGGIAVSGTGTISAGDVTFTNLRVTGVSTVADLFLSTGTNTNGVAFFDASGQVTSTATPSAGIQTSNFILTTNASGVPSWTDTIDCGQF